MTTNTSAGVEKKPCEKEEYLLKYYGIEEFKEKHRVLTDLGVLANLLYMYEDETGITKLKQEMAQIRSILSIGEGEDVVDKVRQLQSGFNSICDYVKSCSSDFADPIPMYTRLAYLNDAKRLIHQFSHLLHTPPNNIKEGETK